MTQNYCTNWYFEKCSSCDLWSENPRTSVCVCYWWYRGASGQN